MEKMDRLGWAAGVSFEAFGLRVGIRVLDPQLLNSLISRVPGHCRLLNSAEVDRLYSVVTPAVIRRNVRPMYFLYGDHGRLSRTERFEELLDSFESDLDFYISANSPETLFIHAGAVRWKEHAILIPGRSRSGKTSLVAEFLRAGASYYSDDLAIVDRSGYLHPYPRPLSVRIADDASRRVRPEDLGAKSAKSGRISVVLFTEYVASASWCPSRITHGEGMLRLLQNVPSARKQPALVIDVLGNAIKNAEVQASYRGEKEQTVNSVLNYLDCRSVA